MILGIFERRSGKLYFGKTNRIEAVLFNFLIDEEPSGAEFRTDKFCLVVF
jgi:hypothetical protein